MIRVLFFASLREAVGMDAWQWTPGAGAPASNVQALLEALQAQLSPAGRAALMADNVRIAVNQQLTDPHQATELRPGDEVAFLPPVTGG